MNVKTLLARIHERDLELFRREAGRHAPVLDKALPRLSHAANKSLLWMGMSSLLWLFGGRFARRAAARGLLSVAMSSMLANGPAKLLTRRPRPVTDEVPLVRRLRREPRSTSFPSGHSASAFAFATGVAMELPSLGLPLAPLATAVAYSRIYTGAHYPSDVVVGSMLGTSVALSTRTFWPVAPSEVREAGRARRAEVEARPGGDGVSIVVNDGAGSALDGNITDVLRESLTQAKIQEIEIEDGTELKDALVAAAKEAEVIGVSGGDGSINCAAQIALENNKPLVVVPGGTLNHLARDIGIENVQSAVDALRSGNAIAMDVARIDGQIFLNTASFGAYPELVDAREKLEDRIGKWPALAIALIHVLRHGEPAEVEIDDERRRIWMIFIGNCRYHPSGFAPAWRERLDDGKLDIRIVDASAPLARLRLVASVLTGRLGRSRIYEQRLAERVKIRSLDGPMRLARDGETFDGSKGFVIEKVDQPLRVYAPVKD
jgi:undecaprenyl-diphosphatase